MRQLNRRTATVLTSSAMLITGLVVFAPAASASAGCHGGTAGHSCYGLDPNSENCSGDARVIETAYEDWPSTTNVALRYSPSCNAFWAHIYNASSGEFFWVQNYAGQFQYYFVPSGYSDGWTNMVDATSAGMAGDNAVITDWCNSNGSCF